MLTSAPRQTSSRRAQPTARIPTICLVGSKTDGHAGRTVGESDGIRRQALASAEEALKYSRTHRVDLWVVHTELPGLSGFELCAMLKAHSPSTPVLLVAKEHADDVERRAWSARATMFCYEATVEEHLGSVLAIQRSSARCETL